MWSGFVGDFECKCWKNIVSVHGSWCVGDLPDALLFFFAQQATHYEELSQ